jgi:serine/threonine protein kinase/tetratricopeptide (TPR) repeat protein
MRRISHYELLEQLGEGGMGVVYKARDIALERLVALKFLPPSVHSDPARLSQLIEEARIAAGLNHPNICTIHELGNAASEESDPFIAMEYLEGRTLRERLADGPLPIRQAAAFAEQIALGLQCAHAKGIIHRDIKPENIFLTDSDAAKVLDFGLALAAGSTATDRAKVSGSGMYMSPEQYRAEDLDARTDIWSFGIVLYEMLTGTAPFRGHYAQAVLYAVLNEEPVPASQLRQEIPPELEALCARCMSKKRNDRPASMDDVIAALRAFRGTGTMPAAPAARNPWFARAAIVTAVVAVIAISAWWLLRDRGDSVGSATALINIALLPMQDVAGAEDSIASWSFFYQNAFQKIFSDNEHLILLDPFTVQSILKGADAGEDRQQLAELNVKYSIQCLVGRSGPGYRVELKLIEEDSRAVCYSKGGTFTNGDRLDALLDTLSFTVFDYLRGKETPAEQARDLNGWVTGQQENKPAEKAFLAAYKKIFDDQPNARVELREAIRLDSSFIAPRIWLASGLWLDERAEATVHLNALKRLRPKASAFEREMIDYVVAFTEDSLPQQRDHLRAALLLSPGNHIVQVNLSRVLSDLQDYESAERVLAPAIRSRWSFSAAYIQYALCLMKLKRFEDAYRTMRQAPEKTTANAYGILLLSGLARKTGRVAEAEQLEERFVRLMRKEQMPNSDIMAAIAGQLHAVDLDSAAVARYSLVLKERPGHVDALLGRAASRSALRELAGAMNDVRDALRAAPRSAPAYDLMGDIASLRGQTKDARDAYWMSLRYDSTSRAAADIRRKLRTLR